MKRAPKGQYGWRSISTPDVLAWGGQYYLYYQGFNEIPGLKGDRAAATVAAADTPDGPWRPLGRVIVDFGAEGQWDSNAIHDPYPLVYRGKTYFQDRVRLPDTMLNRIKRERDKVDRDTVLHDESQPTP